MRPPERGLKVPVEQNVISGNTSFGVYLDGTDTSGNVVAGNFIGTNSSGTAAMPNADGVGIDGSASSNLVGTSGQDGAAADTLERNIISGNTDWGVLISNSSASNVIAGNFIGTTDAGTAAAQWHCRGLGARRLDR